MKADTTDPDAALLPALAGGDARQWYAVYTHFRAEKMVAKRLTDSGITAFLPLQKTLRQWSDRKKMVERPIISSYVFVRVSRREYARVLNTGGVARFITFGSLPVSIPEEQMVNLRILSNSNIDIKVSEDLFIKGDMVEVAYGSLAGLKGELIRVGKRHLVVMRVIESGLCLTVDINKSEIRKIRATEKNKRKAG